MRIEEFAEKVCGAMEKELGDGYRVECREVRKNNGVIRHGLTVLGKGRDVAPTIYLDMLLEAYGSGTPFTAILNRLLDICREDAAKRDIDMGFFRSFEKVRDQICYRLVSRERNEGLLQEMPYVGFLDMAICFHYAYHDDALGDGTIPIHNSHMELWGTSIAELHGLARNNTERLFPWRCQSMAEALADMAGPDGSLEGTAGLDWSLEEVPMKILSNARRVHGAACVLYPGVLERLAWKEGSDLYVIPSSVHEVILLPCIGAPQPEELEGMVREVNRTQVAPEDVLSDSLYRYSRAEDRIGMA